MGYSLFLTGPAYYSEEFESMNHVYQSLQKAGFLVKSSTRHGFQRQVMDFCIAESHTEGFSDAYSQACILAFSLEYYYLLSADACVGILNGTVPDESTIIFMGIAFGSGIPVIQYKYDPRILFPSGLNSMISGLTGDFSMVKKLKQLQKVITKKIEKHHKHPSENYIDHIPPLNRIIYKLGKAVDEYLQQQAIKDFQNFTIENLKDLLRKFQPKLVDNKLLGQFIDKSNPESEKLPFGKVYCSGPLFCPEEVRGMKNIATILENAGFQTFLPQRDGGEPFIINEIDNPLAGSIIAKPVAVFLNQTIFSIDIYEILKCESFVINLNGRVPDDGAMAELGVAFAAGKSILFYKNDIRAFYNGRLHPTLEALRFHYPIIASTNIIPQYLYQIRRYHQIFGENNYLQNLSDLILLTFTNGEKWDIRIKRWKVPENEMELWFTQEG